MTKEFIAQESMRLDKYLSQELNQTRNQIEHLIKKGFVEVQNKKVAKSGHKLQVNQKVKVSLPAVVKKEALEVDFDIEIIYEDDVLLVINKPSGVIVHDAPSVDEPTLVDWLKKKGISLSTISGEERHGIVHRLDKGTSGLLVIAKTNEAHVMLSEQLQDKSMGRYYVAVTDLELKDDILVDKPIYRNPNNRLKQGIVASGKNAKTAFKKLISSTNTQINQKKYEIITAKLFTGRTHQIRVHLESINRHILGDTLYGFKGNEDNINRIYLHAFCLYLIHPESNKEINFVANIPDDMKELMHKNFDEEMINEKINKEYIIKCFSDVEHWV